MINIDLYVPLVSFYTGYFPGGMIDTCKVLNLLLSGRGSIALFDCSTLRKTNTQSPRIWWSRITVREWLPTASSQTQKAHNASQASRMPAGRQPWMYRSYCLSRHVQYISLKTHPKALANSGIGGLPSQRYEYVKHLLT